MKILHTADWHLGKKLFGMDRLEEQAEVLNEIIDICDREGVDAVLIAGDIYDNFNPGSDASFLLYSSLKKLSFNGARPVIAIAGNHDSADRINAPDALARACGIIMMGYPNDTYPPLDLTKNWQITHSGEGFINIDFDHGERLHVTTTAFTSEIRIREYISEEGEEKGLINYLSNLWNKISEENISTPAVRILLAHQLIWPENAREPIVEEDGEKPIHLGPTSVIPSGIIPSTYDYVALGHLHRYQQVPGNTMPIYYSGSPLAYSFSESNQTKYVNIIETDHNNLTITRKLTLTKGKRLLSRTFDSVTDAERWIADNRDSHLEVRIHTSEYLTSEAYKRLRAPTQNILHIIPIVHHEDEDTEAETHEDFSDMLLVFKSFFRESEGIPPNEELLSLFNEIRSLDDPEAS